MRPTPGQVAPRASSRTTAVMTNVPARSTLRQLRVALGIPSDYPALRLMPKQREAIKIVAAGRNPEGRIVKLAPLATRTWRQMQAAASIDGARCGSSRVGAASRGRPPSSGENWPRASASAESYGWSPSPALASTTRAGRSTSVRPAFRSSMSALPGPPGFAG